MDRILIADDEKEIRSLLKLYLENEGYEVAEAGDGEEALPAFDGEAPAQVLAGEDIAAEADAQDPGEELLRDSGVDGNIT